MIDNPDDRIRARVDARRLATQLAEMFLSECASRATTMFSGWAVDYTEAFFDQLRDDIDAICPVKPVAAPQPLQVKQADLPATIDIDKRKHYTCRINGTCLVESANGGLLIQTEDLTKFWVPKYAIGNPPKAGENVVVMQIPGWKILEGELEELVEE